MNDEEPRRLLWSTRRADSPSLSPSCKHTHSLPRAPVLPLPVGAETTSAESEPNAASKHSLWTMLK